MVEKDVGFILRRINFRETSLIITAYTERFGKMSGILKGFYANKREFTSTCDLFTYNEFLFYPKKSDIWLISYIDLLKDFPFLRTDYTKSSYACVIARIIERTMLTGLQNADIFRLVKEVFSHWHNQSPQKMLDIFLIKFLSFSGFKPEFSRCIVCHGEFGEVASFSVSSGGLLCERCQSQRRDCRQISRETSSFIHYIQSNSFPLLLRIKPSPNCLKEIYYILENFLQYHLDFDPFQSLPVFSPNTKSY